MPRNTYPKTIADSFASHSKSEYWHLTENERFEDDFVIILTPRDVRKSTHNKCCFICGDCGHVIYMALNSINRGRWCAYCNYDSLCNDIQCTFCYTKSFATHSKSEYWHPTENERFEDDFVVILTPRDVCKRTHIKFSFYCRECCHSIHISLTSISRDQWCGYCNGDFLCTDVMCAFCNSKSFHEHHKAIYFHPSLNECDKDDFVFILTPRDICKNSNCQKYIFTCNMCNHQISITLSHVQNNRWCGYCKGPLLCKDSMCNFCHIKSFASHSKSKYWHSSKNYETPRDVRKSTHTKYWFICNICSNVFDIAPHKIVEGKWCSKCLYKGQRAVYDCIAQLDSNALCDRSLCPNIKITHALRYDIILHSLRIIIEVMGEQHYRQVRNWNPPHITQSTDIYKMKEAMSRGYTYICIMSEDVRADCAKYLDMLKIHLKRHDTPQLIFIGPNAEKLCAYLKL